MFKCKLSQIKEKQNCNDLSSLAFQAFYSTSKFCASVELLNMSMTHDHI